MATIPLYRVLEEEYVRLHGSLPDHYPQSTNPEERLSAICKLIHELPQKRAALCLSGGGIRSATFGLGVLQGFAAHGLLDKFDYLSTVSGGGYIGSWLTA
ncbi:MAG TPA: patatin-like phospholipase family protein, partial [Candidatus Binatia bacterium]|nr:patatin-like phospholipase family protein [Candidatus Binatia bacterium]